MSTNRTFAYKNKKWQPFLVITNEFLKKKDLKSNQFLCVSFSYRVTPKYNQIFLSFATQVDVGNIALNFFCRAPSLLSDVKFSVIFSKPNFIRQPLQFIYYYYFVTVYYTIKYYINIYNFIVYQSVTV